MLLKGIVGHCYHLFFQQEYWIQEHPNCESPFLGEVQPHPEGWKAISWISDTLSQGTCYAFSSGAISLFEVSQNPLSKITTSPHFTTSPV